MSDIPPQDSEPNPGDSPPPSRAERVNELWKIVAKATEEYGKVKNKKAPNQAKFPLEKDATAAELEARKTTEEQRQRVKEHEKSHWERSKEFHYRMMWLCAGAVTTTATALAFAEGEGRQIPKEAFVIYLPAVAAWICALLVCLLAQLWAMAPLHWAKKRRDGGSEKSEKFPLPGGSQEFRYTLMEVCNLFFWPSLGIGLSGHWLIGGPGMVCCSVVFAIAKVRPQKCNNGENPISVDGYLRQVRYLTQRYGAVSTGAFGLGCLLFGFCLAVIVNEMQPQ